MKKLLFILLVTAMFADSDPHPKKGTIWIEFEEDGQIWMVGAIKEYAGLIESQFTKENSIAIRHEGRTLFFSNCCTDNVVVRDNYIGTIEIDGKKYSLQELKNKIRP